MRSLFSSRWSTQFFYVPIFAALIVLVGLSGATASSVNRPLAGPLTTAFTFQGFLKDANLPASGVFDLEFRLFDALTGGNQLGAVSTHNDVNVADGMFTVLLDFGVTISAPEFIEISVRHGNETGAYTVLSPRQALNATPWAINADLLDGLDASAFVQRTHLLILLFAGSGSGTVSVSPGDVICSDNCGASFSPNTVVTLTATPNANSSFAGWFGVCNGTGNCTITMNEVKLVRAAFSVTSYTLTATRTGGGVVVTTPAGIYCGATCSANFDVNSTVTLLATPDPTAAFVGWTGACSGTSLTCVVAMNAAKSVNARFSLPLSVTKSGAGAGTVTSSPAGISCGSTCTMSYEGGTIVTLTAAPDSSSQFSGWSGACTGTGNCTVTMDTAKSVNATFSRRVYALTLTRSGSGIVVTSPSGLYCGSQCIASFDAGTSVVLTATSDENYVFSGWSGGSCSGTGSCSLTMDAAKSVSATFTQANYTLSVARAGTGGGTVTSTPAGVDCGTTCSASFSSGLSILLSATPDSTSAFAGWAGACTGSAPTCLVTMNAARNVTATFTKQAFVLTAAKTGTGAGTITSAPAGISCGATCAAAYTAGTAVTLSATPDSSSVFVGWSGSCSGTGNCTVTMDTAKNVTATFTRQTYVLTVIRTGAGTVVSEPFGIYCGALCSASFSANSTITLTAVPDSGHTFSGWSGACTGTSPTCTITADAAKSVAAVFN